jgi:hypothetical protein
MSRNETSGGAAKPLAALAGIVASAAAAEIAMGRRLWGVGGRPGLWTGDVNGEHNSQYVADPYSFTHVLHGFALYALLSVLARRSSLRTRAVAAVALEAAWEVLENSDMVIERYRAATISLHYYGDSVVNSMSDIAFCALGFYVASRLRPRWTAALFVATELILLVAVRDNLTLNVLMLLHPLPWIKAWQLAPR